ncbi:MAG: copper chaperone PCu(A)C [Acidimicrobiales bacterium]
MTTDSTPSTSIPERSIYTRILRFAPLYVVVFCTGVLLLVAFLRPFESPKPTLSTSTELVGSDNNPTGAYFNLRNSGGPDTLLGASTPAASSIALQIIDPTTTSSTPDTLTSGGSYITVGSIDIPGFADMKFAPGGNQLLLTGIDTPLVVGQTIPITLQFERAGTLTITAEVQPYSVIADRLLPPRLKLSAGQ